MNPKYPTLAVAFDIKHTCIYAMIAMIVSASCLYVYGDARDGIATYFWLAVVPIVFPLAKLEGAWIFCNGHGVYEVKKILRIPWALFILVSVLYLLIVAIFVTGFYVHDGFPTDEARHAVFASGMLFALTLSVMRWQFKLYYAQWCASEYEFREHLQSKGAGKHEIDLRVKYARTEGWLLTEKEAPKLGYS